VILAIWFVLQLFSGVGQLASRGERRRGRVWAHVGGFAFGALVAWLFYRNRRGPKAVRSGATPTDQAIAYLLSS
jgi:membrane associated rhomboid family serine protease